MMETEDTELRKLARARCTLKAVALCFSLTGVANLVMSIVHRLIMWTTIVHVLTLLLGIYAFAVSRTHSPFMVRTFSNVSIFLFCLWMALHALSIYLLLSDSAADTEAYFWPVYAAIVLLIAVSCSFSISSARRMERILLSACLLYTSDAADE